MHEIKERRNKMRLHEIDFNLRALWDSLRQNTEKSFSSVRKSSLKQIISNDMRRFERSQITILTYFFILVYHLWAFLSWQKHTQNRQNVIFRLIRPKKSHTDTKFIFDRKFV